MSFYVIGVMVVFNVFASFIIDLFLAVYDQVNPKPDDANTVGSQSSSSPDLGS